MPGKLYTYPNNFKAQRILITAEFSGKKVELPEFIIGQTNKTPEFLKKFPLGKVPAYEEDGLALFEPNAIAYYVGNSQTRGGDSEPEVLQWIGVAENDIMPAACTWVYPTLGIMQYNKASTEKAKEDIKAVMTFLNSHLLTHTFLVGERITQADIALACTLLMLYTNVMDGAFREPYGNVNRWFCTLINQPQFQAVLGKVELCSTMAQFNAKKYNEISGKNKKKETTPKAKKETQKQEKKASGDTLPPPPPKKADPWASCGPPTYDMDAWKRTYSNGTVDEYMQYFFDNFPKENYSIWSCKYKFNHELTMPFMSMNLINGMLQRIERMKKHSFGVMLLLESPCKKKTEIRGLWFWLGEGLAFDLCEDWRIDSVYYDWEKVPIDAESTKELVRKFWTWEGDFGNGYEVNDGTDHK